MSSSISKSRAMDRLANIFSSLTNGNCISSPACVPSALSGNVLNSKCKLLTSGINSCGDDRGQFIISSCKKLFNHHTNVINTSKRRNGSVNHHATQSVDGRCDGLPVAIDNFDGLQEYM